MKKKYELTNESMVWEGHTLYRIRYIDGTQGGWIESYNNLSQEGKCRVLENAKVWEGALVCDDAQVSGNAQVCGKPLYDALSENIERIRNKIHGGGEINLNDFGSWSSEVGFSFESKEFQEAMTGFMQDLRRDMVLNRPGYAKVCDNAVVTGRAQVKNSKICDHAQVSGNAKVIRSIIKDNALVSDNETVSENTIGEYEVAQKEAAKKAKRLSERQEVVDEIIYMIEQCPRGQRYTLLPNIVSLMLLFSSGERDKILELYEVWRGKDGGVFSPHRQQIEDMIDRLENSGQSPSQIEVKYPQQSSSSQGGYSPSSNPRMGNFMDDMRESRRGQMHRGGYNPEEGGNY